MNVLQKYISTSKRNLPLQAKASVIIVSLFCLSSCAIFKKKTRISQSAADVIATARSFTGTPYRTGGVDGRGMDCSGLIMTSFEAVGIRLPRISWQQAEAGREVGMTDVRPGDLVFFVTNKKGQSAINHSGIVTRVSANEIWFIHASSSKGVREDNLNTPYWRQAFAKLVRVI